MAICATARRVLQAASIICANMCCNYAEAYRESLDERQNKNTTLLAVVSAVFLPLSLLAGWYGMNFRNMPELNSEYGYPTVFILSLAIVIIEIIFFKKHHLL